MVQNVVYENNVESMQSMHAYQLKKPKNTNSVCDVYALGRAKPNSNTISQFNMQ